MGDPTSQVLNGVLRRAGIAAADLEVVSCASDQGSCLVRYPEAASTMEKNFSTMEELFSWVNDDWLHKHPPAKRQTSHAIKLFQPLNENWVLIDTDGKEGSEGLFYLATKGWAWTTKEPGEGEGQAIVDEILQRAEVLLSADELKNAWSVTRRDSDWFLKLLDLLASKSWSDAGLKANHVEFGEFSFPFVATPRDPEASASDFVTPLDKVVLLSEEELEIPWTDPFLFMEWQAFLKEAGVEIRQEGTDTWDSFIYSYRGLPLMRLVRRPNAWKWEFFSPLGAKTHQASLPAPTLPKMGIRVLDRDAGRFRMEIGDLQVEVEFHTPQGFSEKDRIRHLMQSTQMIAKIPQSLLKPLLSARGQETPLRIAFADRETAVKHGWLSKKHFEISAGTYDPRKNLVWVELKAGTPPILDNFFHEIGGHALSDLQVSEDNARYLTHPEASALSRYYNWKLIQLFSPEELEDFAKLSAVHAKWRQIPPDKRPKAPEGQFDLLLYLKMAEGKFVSDYAVQGPDGVKEHAKLPEEDLAEVMEIFLKSLNLRENWGEYRKREPLLKLVGLHYLFSTYPVSKIGMEGREITREEVFSEKAFQNVLGITLKDVGNLFPTPKAVPEKTQSGNMTFLLSLGLQRISFLQSDSSVAALRPQIGLRVGWGGDHWGLGASLEFLSNPWEDRAGIPKNILDGGLWGGLHQDMGSIGIYLQTGLGIRESNGVIGWDASWWLENRLGLGLNSGQFQVSLQHKRALTEAGWSQWGIGVAWDL